VEGAVLLRQEEVVFLVMQAVQEVVALQTHSQEQMQELVVQGL
jgi:hypothetical protein